VFEIAVVMQLVILAELYRADIVTTVSWLPFEWHSDNTTKLNVPHDTALQEMMTDQADAAVESHL
jgi:phytoene/squalene synthetase